MSDKTQEIRNTLINLLHSIQRGDVEAYKKMVSEQVTCFEPETQGHRIEGLDFHLFLTKHHKAPQAYHLELVNPVFQAHGKFGYTSYTLLISKVVDEVFEVSKTDETRIFAKEDHEWKLVHFHRSRAEQ